MAKVKEKQKRVGIQTEWIGSLHSIFLMSNVRLSLIRFLSLTREGILILKKGLRKLLILLLIRLFSSVMLSPYLLAALNGYQENKIYWLLCWGFKHILKAKLKNKTGNKRDIRFLNHHLLSRWKLQREQITDRAIAKHFQERDRFEIIRKTEFGGRIVYAKCT